MHIKDKLRSILGDLLVQLPNSCHYKERVINKQAIKNVIFDANEMPSELSSPSSWGFMKILATDPNNANQIKTLIQHNKDELCVQSVHVNEDKALGYSSRYIEKPVYKSTVIVKLDPKVLFQSATTKTSDLLRKEILGPKCYDEQKADKVVIEFSSPNIAKPFHFGHLKSTILGNYLSNINRYVGNTVTRMNYIGDWGTQYGLLSLGLEEFGEKKLDSIESPLRYLLDIYIRANERGKQDEKFYSDAKCRFLEISAEANPDHLEKWKKIRDISLEELKESYSHLGVEFDVFEHESDYARESLDLVNRMMSQDFVKKIENGVTIAEVEKNGRIHQVPLLKSDGSSLYITRDIAAAIKRYERHTFDRMLYVVGADQERHFHYLKGIVGNLHHKWHKKLIHVKMGKVIGMSSRSGTFVLLSDIIDEATKQYTESTRNTPTSKVAAEEDIKEVGKHLALSSLFVYDMRNARTRNYDFDWEQVMLASDRSGINLQTTFARLSSLLQKASLAGLSPIKSPEEFDEDAICCIEGMNLLSYLDNFEIELHSAYWSMDPSPLVNYALKLCKAINRARRSERLWVLDEPNEGKARTRLSLFENSHSQLELIIKLIGLKPLYKV